MGKRGPQQKKLRFKRLLNQINLAEWRSFRQIWLEIKCLQKKSNFRYCFTYHQVTGLLIILKREGVLKYKTRVKNVRESHYGFRKKPIGYWKRKE